jgi:uncharacterized protein involved in exopolysaccharide biosynthesis
MWFPFRNYQLLNEINARLTRIERQLTEGEKRMSAELDALTAAVQKEDTVIDSAITLIKGLAGEITAAKDDPAKLTALAADVNAKADALAAAVTANTPAAPTTAPAPSTGAGATG